MSRQLKISTLVIVYCLSTGVHAEFPPPNDNSQNQNSQDNSGSFSNGVSGGIFNGMAVDPSKAKENENNKSNGREYKAADAENQGSLGGGIAAGLGAAMIGIGVPMATSPEIVTMIAGLDLIAKGALEIAQGAADMSSAGKNGAQRDQLMNNSDSRVSPPPKEAQINSPELDKILGESGVNADDFKRRLLNGEFQSGADIAAALGKTGISPEDLAAGQALANSQFAGISNANSGELGKPNNAVITGNERAGADAPSSDPDATSTVASAGGTGGASGANGTSSSVSSPAAGAIGPDGKPLKLASHVEGELAGKEGAGSGLFDMNKLIMGVLGDNASAADKALATSIARMELAKMGIQMRGKGTNIFDTAHRNYGNFRRWRKTSKIALR